jgi:hypothetical protein
MPKRKRSEKRIQNDRERQRRLRAERPEVAAAWSAKSYAKHKPKRLAEQRAYYRRTAADKNARAAEKYKSLTAVEREAYLKMSRKSKLKRRYGLTIEQFDALLAAQNGVCAICCRPETHKKYARLSVDHDTRPAECEGFFAVVVIPCSPTAAMTRRC